MKTPHSSWAQHHDAAYHRSFGGFYDTLTEVTIECVKNIQPPPARIVDFGAGTGRLALPLTRAGYSVVALDPCAEMLAVLKSKAAKENLVIQTACCRMQDVTPSPPFDLALCVFTVLLYLLDEDAVNASFQRAAAALRPGGKLLLDIPTRQVFQSYRRAESDFFRDVQVIPVAEAPAMFRYEESTRFMDGDVWVDYTDSFLIRHWENSQIFKALEQAGLVVEADLSPGFAGSGSEYFLVALRSGA